MSTLRVNTITDLAGNPFSIAAAGSHVTIGPYAGSTTFNGSLAAPYRDDTKANVVGLEIKNNGGTGENNAAAISFHCQSQYGMHMHLRPDGYFGIGGWSASPWRWYVNMSTGDMTAVGNITANGVNLGNGVATGYYGDGTNLAVRVPNATGGLYIQSPSGAATWALFQANALSVYNDLYMNSGYGSAAIAYGCRAWVSFNAYYSAVAESGNVSSIADYGVGNKGVNFTTNMPDTNYAVTSSALGGGNFAVTSTAAKYTSSVTIGIWSASGSTVFDRYSSPNVMVMVVR